MCSVLTIPAPKTKQLQRFSAHFPNSSKRTEGRAKFQSKTRGWSDTRRAQQAARIRVTRPWLKATGPRTEAGRVRSAQNALVHGHRSAQVKAIRAVLRWHRLYINRVRAHLALMARRRPFHSRDLAVARAPLLSHDADSFMIYKIIHALSTI